MPLTVTLRDFVPLPRSDGVSWQKALIEEAAAEGGPWALIDEQGLTTEPHPDHPAARDSTTHQANITSGWYRVSYRDASGFTTEPTAPVQRRIAGGVRPSVAEVAAYIRARTKKRGGGEEGVFDDNTRPTSDEVEALITDAESEVLGKIKAPIEPGSGYEGRARRTVALYAAILVELSYFPEQVRNDQSPVATYQKLYESRIAALVSEGIAGEPGTVPTGEEAGGALAPPADAAWSFPSDAGGLVGWNTQW